MSRSAQAVARITEESWPTPQGRRAAFAPVVRADLATVRAHVAAACAAAGVTDDMRDALVLATDEVCANVVTHAYATTPGPLTVDVDVTPAPVPGADGSLAALGRVTVIDAGPPFDPAAVVSHDVSVPLDARTVGGLGWLLVRRSVDTVHYARAGGHNVVTLRKRGHVASTLTHPSPGVAMQISIAQQADITVIAVAGSLDALTADALTRALQTQVRAGRTQLVASLVDLDYTSSAGLRVLLATLKEARQRGGDLRLAGPRERVRRVLELSGFLSILQSFPDVSSAVASFAT